MLNIDGLNEALLTQYTLGRIEGRFGSRFPEMMRYLGANTWDVDFNLVMLEAMFHALDAKMKAEGR